MGRGSFPTGQSYVLPFHRILNNILAIEHGMRGMRVGGTRIIIIPSALGDIDMSWKAYMASMNIPGNSTVYFRKFL